ncbi:hypothetical protein BDW68DRAFT_95962 [Aspergillus falconensis]
MNISRDNASRQTRKNPKTKRNKYWESQQGEALKCSIILFILTWLTRFGKVLSIAHTIPCLFSALRRRPSAGTSHTSGTGMASPFAPDTNEENISAKCVPISAAPSNAATIQTNSIAAMSVVTAVGTYMITAERDGFPRRVIDFARYPVIIHRRTRGGANKNAIMSLDAIVPSSDVDDSFAFTNAYLRSKSWCLMWLLVYSIVAG